jgi:glucose-1-phosphate thymidylyltransferase
MKAIILAAGYATRLYPLTKDKPKALLPISGKPVIDYILDNIEKISAVDGVYVVSNNKFATHFERWVEQTRYSKPVKIIDDGTKDEDERKGAIGDIQLVIEREKIDDNVVIIAGDNFFTFSLDDAYVYFKNRGGDCVCAKRLNDREELKRFGIAEIDSVGKITGFEEKPSDPKSDIVVYATYFLKKSTVPLIGKYLRDGNSPDALGNFIKWLCKRENVYAYVFKGECYDIGTRESYDMLCNIVDTARKTAAL